METYLTEREVLDAHAQFGKVNWHWVKAAMGPNWPAHWEALGPGEAIFAVDESPHFMPGTMTLAQALLLRYSSKVS